MYTMLAAALALASTVCATPISRRDDSVFSFWTNSPNLTEWAVVNAHVNAGVNLIEIQRPTAYTSDNATFNDTRVVFQLQSEGSTYQYGLTLPDVEEGSVGEVTATEGGQTGTPHFGFNSDDLALYNNDYPTQYWYACPTDVYGVTNFVLYWGYNVDAAKLPTSECQDILLLGKRQS